MMKIKIKDISGSINSVPGYKALGVVAGIKKQNKPDLAAIISTDYSVAAGVFTKNSICAAPVKVGKSKISKGLKKLILVNSGNANACTGQKGIEIVNQIERYAADKFNLKDSEILSCSTGIIGVQMPIEKVLKGIDKLAENAKRKNFKNAAEAIMTTDTFPKEVALEITAGKHGTFRIGGIAKGSGMIAPNMATMLAFIVTDCYIKRKVLKKILKECTEKTFNKITVDGDMSTNDSVICLANSSSGHNSINYSGIATAFKEGLMTCMERLSKMIIMDGEGATKLIEINVTRASSDAAAKKIAAKIANSNLLKTAIYGQSPNWGRIIAAAGSTGIVIQEDKIDIMFGDIINVRKGVGIPGKEIALKKYLTRKEIKLTINLNMGSFSCRFLTCDMTPEYVRINADYS